jgi:ATP-binding cassette subfamily B protein
MKPWWLRLMHYVRLPKGGLLLIMLLMLLSVVLNVLRPWPMKLLIDHVLARRPLPDNAAWISVLPGGASPSALLGWLVGFTVVLFLASGAIGITQGYVQAGVGNRMAYSLGAQVFDHLQRLSLLFHSRHTTADLMRRVTNDNNCVRGLVMGILLPALTSLISLAMMFTVMWQLDRSLLLFALAAVVPLGLIIKFFTGPMTERTYQQQQLQGEMMALAEQTLTALPIVQAFNREEHEDRRYRALSQRSVNAYLRAIFSQLQFKIGANTVTTVCTILIMTVGGLHVLQGSLSVGSLLIFLAYLGSLYAPIESFVYSYAEMSSMSINARRILEVLESEDEVQNSPGAIPLPVSPSGKRGHIRLENITFGYEPGRTVLRGISMEALPGETVAIVGPTGVGKSTLVSLLPRLFDPWEGRVTIDGCDIRDVQLKSLREDMAIVLQEPFLLPLTIAENIAYGRPGASRAEIESAARAANAHSFIERLPNGYDTIIGERGATLSGGERQRLSIARSLLKDAPVLILDEPTSALDAQTEVQLLDALDRLMEGRTTFIIAHRLSTLRRADRIVVLKDGRVAEMGTHDQLMEARGFYEHFHNLQFGLVTLGTGPNAAREPAI